MEKLEKLKEDITRIQGIMVTVSTGRGNIDDFEEEYRKLYFSIKEQLKVFRKEGISFPNSNFHSSLWDFYSYWKVELKTYQERREYVRLLYKTIDDAITQVLMKVSTETTDPANLEKLLSSLIGDSVKINESRVSPPSVEVYDESEDEFEYDIALSFAGENRKIADDLARALLIEGVKVFYDKFYKSEMWGKKLTDYFQDVYGPKARFVIALISKHYPIKDWTDYEFSIARGEAKKRKAEFILPVKLDDTKILGIHEDVKYLDLESEGVEGIVDSVREKLNIKERSISKGIFVTTLGVNFEDLVEKEIISEKDWREYPKTCDKLESDLRAKLDKSSIGKYHFTEPSARNGETLSVRFAHYWDLSGGLPDFSFTDYWDFLEFRPVEEIYPDSHKEVKSMFRGTIPNKR